MTKEDWKRAGMHIPWGILGAFPLSWWLFKPSMLAIGIVASIVSVWLMIGYEAFNDWRKKDNSYKDVLGIVHGYLIGVIIIFIVGLVEG